MKSPRLLASLAFTGLLLGALPPASAVVRRDDQPDSAYRQLGARAAFASVGRVDIDYGNGYVPIGTATLFGRDRLVSAAHVFDDDALYGARHVRINFGNGRVEQIAFRTAGVVNVDPNFDSGTLRNDVSVVFLSQKFRLTPATFYGGRRPALDTPITFVGYGNTGTGLTGSSRYSIQKRAGQNALGRYVGRGHAFEVDFDNPASAAYSSMGSRVPLRLEGLLGPGDSGGSAWVRVGKKWRLVGINDYGIDWFPKGRGDGTQDDYGDLSGFVYLPSYKKWIKSLDNPFSSDASFAAVPEPGTIALLTLGSLALLVRRRRT